MQDPAIVKRFIALAGGPLGAPIVVIPTAGEADAYIQSWSGFRVFSRQRRPILAVLHTRDPQRWPTVWLFVAPLAKAHGVFFAGGRR